MFLADDDPVKHGHLTPLLRLEPRKSGGVVHPEPRRHPADLIPLHVFGPWRKKRRAAVEELHVSVLVLRHLPVYSQAVSHTIRRREEKRGLEMGVESDRMGDG